MLIFLSYDACNKQGIHGIQLIFSLTLSKQMCEIIDKCVNI